MTADRYFRHLREQLVPIYGPGEATAIAELVTEHFTGISRSERIAHPEKQVYGSALKKMEAALNELLTHRPVQYVLGRAEFCGEYFFTDESVLIPRPETALLVEQAVHFAGNFDTPVHILDIGTGSGCIPVSIKKQLPGAEVWAIDISEPALHTARKNAQALNTEVHFLTADITEPGTLEQLPGFDIVVSNPPYIPHNNQPEMHRNVTAFEPHTALFVPGNDALFFYRHIVQFVTTVNKKRPVWLCCEIHEDYGKEVAGLFLANNFREVAVKKDDFEKDRVVVGWWE